jgi:hypothetical protein
MTDVTTDQEVDHHRRRVFGAGALALAAAQFGMIRSAVAQSSETEQIPSSGTNTSFSSPKQVDAGVLSVGYADIGPASDANGRSAPGCGIICWEILGHVCASVHQGWYRTQSAAGSLASFCPSRHRHRQRLIDTGTNSDAIGKACTRLSHRQPRRVVSLWPRRVVAPIVPSLRPFAAGYGTAALGRNRPPT